jgi:hypothetical protein
MKEKRNARGVPGVNVFAIKDFNICIGGQYTGIFSVSGIVNSLF